MPKRLLLRLGCLLLLFAAIFVYFNGLLWSTGRVTLIYVADADDVNASPAQAARLNTLRGGRGRYRGVLTIAGTEFSLPSQNATTNGELAGTLSVDALNSLGVDVAILGGRGFDRPEDALRTLVRGASGHVLANNVANASGKPVADLSPGIVVPVLTWTGSIDVGFIGLTQESGPSWATRTDPIEAAKNKVPGTRKWARAVVVVTDLSLEAGRALFAAVPDIDLLLGGRDHALWAISPGAAGGPPAVSESTSNAAAVVTMMIDRAKTRPATTVRFEGS